jgi:hypothetical protein
MGHSFPDLVDFGELPSPLLLSKPEETVKRKVVKDSIAFASDVIIQNTEKVSPARRLAIKELPESAVLE